MITLLKDIWKCKKSLATIWVTFFTLSLFTDYTLNPYKVLIYSFIFSVIVTIIGIIYIKITIKY